MNNNEKIRQWGYLIFNVLFFVLIAVTYIADGEHDAVRFAIMALCGVVNSTELYCMYRNTAKKLYAFAAATVAVVSVIYIIIFMIEIF